MQLSTQPNIWMKDKFKLLISIFTLEDLLNKLF